MTDANQPVGVADPGQVEGSDVIRGLFGRDMMYLAFWGMQIIVAAALTPATTRLMGKTAFGQAAASIAVMQLLNSIFSFSLYTAVQRAFPGENGDDRARHLVTLSIVLSLLMGALAYATGGWWCPLVGLGAFPSAVRYAVLWAVMSAITAPALGLIRSRDDLRGFVAASFAQSVFAQALALALVVLVRATASEYILGQLIGEVVTAAIALNIVRPKLPGREHLPLLGNALRFSAGLVPAAIAGFVFEASDRIVINADLGAGAVGRYAVARNLGGFVLVLLQLVSLVWMPRLFAMTGAATRGVLARSRDGIYALTVTFAIAISAAAPLLLRLWAPPSYHPQHLLLVMALVAACGFPSADAMIYTQALILGGRTAAVAVISVSGAMLNLGLNIALVPVLGIDGSAGITLGCYTLGAVLTRWWVGAGGPPTNWRPLFLAVAGVAVCISLAAVPSSGVALALRLVIAAASTITFFLALRVLVRSDGA